MNVPTARSFPTMRRLIFLLLAAAGLSTLPASLTAQMPRSLRVYPRVGLLSPDSYFYEHFENFLGDGLTEWTHTSLGRTFIAGVGAEIPVGKSAYVRAEVMRTFDGWLLASHSKEKLRDLFIPPEIVTTWLDVPYTLTLTSLQLVLPTRLRWGPVDPYVLVGGGGKYYQFGASTRPDTVGATLPTNGFTWGGDLGAGCTVQLMGLHVDLQARDAWSRYWGKFQHDIVYSGNVSLRVF